MKFYKTQNNEIYAYEKDVSSEFLAKKIDELSLIAITKEQADLIVAEKNQLSNEQKREIEINQLKGYLASTDFYYTRKEETGEAVPEAVVAKRLEARNRIRELEIN